MVAVLVLVLAVVVVVVGEGVVGLKVQLERPEGKV